MDTWIGLFSLIDKRTTLLPVERSWPPYTQRGLDYKFICCQETLSTTCKLNIQTIHEMIINNRDISNENKDKQDTCNWIPTSQTINMHSNLFSIVLVQRVLNQLSCYKDQALLRETLNLAIDNINSNKLARPERINTINNNYAQENWNNL